VSGLGLLNPWGLAALGSLAAVGVIYLFYQRYRKRPITALFLWDAPEGWHEGGRRLSRLRLTRSLLLDALACALLALAVASPAWISRAGRSAVVVLDGSLSMRGSGNHDRARDEALSILESVGRLSRPVVIEAGSEPRVLAGPGADADDARRALGRYDPFDTSDSLEEALRLAREIVTGHMEVHVLTDREARLAPPAAASLTLHVLEGRAPNAAIVDAARHVSPRTGNEDVVVSIAGFATSPLRAHLEARAGTSVIHEQDVSLGPADVRQVTLQVNEETGPLEILLESGSDALEEDSRVLLLEEPLEIVTYEVDVADPAVAGPVTRALAAAGALPAGDSEPDLLVTRGADAEGTVTTLRLATGGEKGAALLGPYVIDMAHPLCRDLDLTGVYWTTAAGTGEAAQGMPLVSCGDRSLYHGVGGGVLVLDLDPSASNITRTAAWPVLVSNVVRHTSQGLPGLRRTNYLPAEVPLFVPHPQPDLNPERIEAAGSRIPWERTSIPPRLPARPGVYTLVLRGGASRDLAVNAIAPLESDLRALAEKSRTTRTGSLDARSAGASTNPLGWILVALAALALSLNWLLDRRRT
jgi:hypothetical protein